MTTTPITGALVVIVAAAGVAIGALALDAGDTSGPASSGPDPTVQASDGGGSGYGDSAADGTPTNAGGASLEISGFQFGAVSVAGGGQVTVDNRDSATHTVTADDDEFDTGQVSGGGTSSFVAPSTPGTYEFHCQIHPDMSGTLTVG
jgi:plastocyanin